MQYAKTQGGFLISEASDFDAQKIFDCGQCFRWEQEDDGSYLGMVNGKASHLSQFGGDIIIEGGFDTKEELRSYFDLDRDYALVRRRLTAENEFLCSCARFGAGIRILHQDFWETLCSFIISQCNNIPRIKKIISALCENFGAPVEYRGKVLYTFPEASVLASCTEKELGVLRCGYRAEYIIDAAQKLCSGALDPAALSQMEPEQALKRLKSIRGVGDKVANCVLLFGLHMLSAFPRDVWIKRAMKNELSGFAPENYSDSAGIVQQYIFYYYRSIKTTDNPNVPKA